MATATKIFVSATSTDLRTFRNQVKVWLLDMGWLPVVQDHFAPDDQTVVEMLRKRVSECDAVVHIIGRCYGAEPKMPLKGAPRRSYTQIEAVFAPSQGFFGLSAELAPASYVLTQACHLTGGFAFYIWFPPSLNAGQ